MYRMMFGLTDEYIYFRVENNLVGLDLLMVVNRRTHWIDSVEYPVLMKIRLLDRRL